MKLATYSTPSDPSPRVGVVADDAVMADALSTAMMVMGPDEGYELAGALGVAANLVVREDDGFREYHTPEFNRYPIEI